MKNIKCEDLVLMLGSQIYEHPLHNNFKNKFKQLTSNNSIIVVAKSTKYYFESFFDYAKFYLLPKLPIPGGGFLTIQVISPILLLWLCLSKNIQCIIAQSPIEAAPVSIVIWITKFFKSPPSLIIESHGDFENSLFLYKDIKFKKIVQFYFKILFKIGFSQATLLRAVSTGTARQLKKYKPQVPCYKYPAWIQMNTFIEASEHAKIKQPWVVYAGDICYLKGIDILIKSFQQVHRNYQNAQLFLIGKCNDMKYKEKLKESILQLGLNKRVHFFKFLPSTQLAKIIASAKVSVLPSRSDGFGRVIVESLASGTPVVCTTNCGISECLEKFGGAKIVPIEDPLSISTGISEFLKLNTYETDKIKKLCISKCNTIFNEEEYIFFYNKIIAKSIELNKFKTNRN